MSEPATAPSPGTSSHLLVEVSEGAALVRLNRPAKRNALSRGLLADLVSTVERLDAAPDVRAIVLTGAGSAFCGGVDLVALRDDPEFAATVGPRTRGVLLSRTPLIGAVNGAAYTGGLELALSCHFLIASDEAVFADTHSHLGLMPGWGLSVLLAEAVGVRRARQMSATSSPVDAATALGWGLVNEVVSADNLLPRCLEIAAAITQVDSAAVGSMMELYSAQQDARDHAQWQLEAAAWRKPHQTTPGVA